MKTQFFILMVVVMSFISAQAKTRPALRLEQHFANPTKDFSWMSEDERAKYLSFIVSLNILLEAELSRGTVLMINDNLKKESHFKWQNEFFQQLFAVEEARALGPLLIPLAVGTAVSTVVRSYAPSVITHVIRQAPKNVIDITPKVATWWQKLGTGRNLTIGSTVVGGAYVAVDSLTGDSNGATPPPGDGGSGSVPSFDGISGIAAPAVVAGAPVVVAGAEPPTAQAAAVPPANTAATGSRPKNIDGSASADVVARAEGSFCIFGGYGSRYKVVESRSFCPAPTEMVNNPFCAGKKINPSFLCQSFGLSKSRTEAIISDNLCISLRSDKGLTDLTIRCAKAFMDFADSAKAIDPAKLTEIQNQVLEAIKALEAERGVGDVGLLGYCKDENKLNRGAQKSECKALTELMDKYKKDFPRIVAAAKKATASPAAAPVPAAAPAPAAR